MTLRTLLPLLASASTLALACSATLDTSSGAAGTPAGPPSTSPTPPKLPPDTVDPGGTGPQYDNKGFVVHEWGTNTIVVGSDGSMQRGLHHEEEDLPAFVYDRRKKGEIGMPADVKMETPVVYFYSPRALDAHVEVSFPKGILTQWYPAVSSFWPPVFKDKGDPALDMSFAFTSPSCRSDYAKVHDGRLDWMTVKVLGRDAPITTPDAPLDRFTWSHARAVAANPIVAADLYDATGQIPDQAERFLFYRGLGNFPLDVTIAAQAGPPGQDGGVTLKNTGNARVGAVFVLRVEADKAAFVARPEGIPAGASLDEIAPAATVPLDTYANDLAKAMVAELDRGGLYHDESVSMVKTWARQWFRTPGVRVLYMNPQSATEAQIPLSIDPKPDQVVRQMIIRVEVITRAQESADVASVNAFDAAGSASRGHFDALGRFAEPRLRRAITLAAASAPKSAYAYLDTIATADVSSRTGE